MDDLGKRIIEDTAKIRQKRADAFNLEQQAELLKSEANELERLLELARISHG